jgi:hypothetical protein
LYSLYDYDMSDEEFEKVERPIALVAGIDLVELSLYTMLKADAL